MKCFILCCNFILIAFSTLYAAKDINGGVASITSISNALTETDIAKLEISELKKLAEQGQADAQVNLAAYYASGEDVPKDMTEAVKWCRKAAEQEQADAQLFLGYFYSSGEGVPKDMAEAVKWYRKAAEQGQADAQNIHGNCYYSGEGVPKDMAEAVKWYRKAAEQGQADAQCMLGVRYECGEGVSEDLAEAVKWYRKAAEQGQADAQANLGACYYSGEGVPKDVIEAVKWYRKAAEQGQADAQNILGNCYYSGEGVSENKAEAVKWYRKAAEQGQAVAQLNLGTCYECGEGVPEDESLAATWYSRAAELGNARAMGELSACYFVGYGVPLNISKAFDRMAKASVKNDGDALDPIKTLAIFWLCEWSGILLGVFLIFVLQQILYKHTGRFGKHFITILRWVEAALAPGVVCCTFLCIGGALGLMLLTYSGIRNPIPYLFIDYITPILSAIALPLTIRAFAPSNKNDAVVVIGLVWLFVLVAFGLVLVLGGLSSIGTSIDIKQLILFGASMLTTIRIIGDGGK